MFVCRNEAFGFILRLPPSSDRCSLTRPLFLSLSHRLAFSIRIFVFLSYFFLLLFSFHLNGKVEFDGLHHHMRKERVGPFLLQVIQLLPPPSPPHQHNN